MLSCQNWHHLFARMNLNGMNFRIIKKCHVWKENEKNQVFWVFFSQNYTIFYQCFFISHYCWIINSVTNRVICILQKCCKDFHSPAPALMFLCYNAEAQISDLEIFKPLLFKVYTLDMLLLMSIYYKGRGGYKKMSLLSERSSIRSNFRVFQDDDLARKEGTSSLHGAR